MNEERRIFNYTKENISIVILCQLILLNKNVPHTLNLCIKKYLNQIIKIQIYGFHYEKKVLTVIVNNSTNIDKTNNHISP